MTPHSDSRAKVYVLLTIQALRLMLTVDADGELQQRLGRLPSILVLRLGCYTRVVRSIVVDHEQRCALFYYTVRPPAAGIAL